MVDAREEKPASDSKLEISNFKEICEGKARVLFPQANTVFYNNVQVFNRDLSVAVIKLFAKQFQQEKEQKVAEKHKKQPANKTITSKEALLNESKKDESENTKSEKKLNVLEALSASGLRAIRYALEIPALTDLIANDLSKEAVNSIERNIKHNNVGSKVKSSLSDAR